MCTCPVKILNPSKWIAPDQGQQLYLYVPCGHCSECRSQKRNEWRIRSWSECCDTIVDGGYTLFDTLTYASEYLPRLSDFVDVPKHLDFSCFRADDITLFFKRLRIRLTRMGYDPSDKLKYFLVCEYGKRNTRRPHYHLFFFVRQSFVPCLVLSQAIADAWHLGRTDGLPYKTATYVKFHNTFDSLDSSATRVVAYVSKYVSKEFGYSDMAQSRLYRLMDYYYPNCDWQAVKEFRGFHRMLARFVSPFHRQSLNFGYGIVARYGVDNIVKNGYFVANLGGYPRQYSLFPSLKRKLFYDYKKVNGDVTFYLNQRGVEFNRNQILRRVAMVQNMVTNYNLNNSDKIDINAFELLYNQHRLQPASVADNAGVVSQILSSSSVDEYKGLRNYSSVDYPFVHNHVFAKRDFGSKKHGFRPLLRYRLVHEFSQVEDCAFLPLSDLKRKMLFDSKLQSDYDKLLRWTADNGSRQLAVEKRKEQLLKIYKSYNLC